MEKSIRDELDLLLQEGAAEESGKHNAVDGHEEETMSIETVQCGRRDSMDLAFARGVPAFNRDSSETDISSDHLDTSNDVNIREDFEEFMFDDLISIRDEEIDFNRHDDIDPILSYIGRRDSLLLAQKRGESFRVKSGGGGDRKRGTLMARILSSWQQLFGAKISPDYQQDDLQYDELFDKWLVHGK